MLLVERVERRALADRQALSTAALVLQAKGWKPFEVETAVAEFEAWLDDDVESREAAVEARMRELMGQEVA